MKTLLQIAGLLQLSLLVATALVPRVLDWRTNLAKLPLFVRQHVWVNGVFIVYTIIAFGVLTLLHANTLAAGDPLARSLCLIIGLFWASRLFVQFFVFDAKPFLTNWFYKAGYHALTLIFIALVAIYAAAAFFSGSANASPARTVSSAGRGVSPRHSFKVRDRETRSPALETSALPENEGARTSAVRFSKTT